MMTTPAAGVKERLATRRGTCGERRQAPPWQVCMYSVYAVWQAFVAFPIVMELFLVFFYVK